MLIGETIRNAISARCNETARLRGLEVKASMIQGGGKFAAVGIPLPNLLTRVQETHPDFVRCHIAIGALVVGTNDFEVGTAAPRYPYIGIRTHKGDLTLKPSEHAEIFHETHDALCAALADEVTLHPRDGVWSIFGNLPTETPEGRVRTAEEYQDFMVDQLLLGWLAIKDLWDMNGRAIGAPKSINQDVTTPIGSSVDTSTSSTRWSYQEVASPTLDDVNRLGAEGWELITITTVEAQSVAWLKKRL